jgi:hypothetical protein
MPEANIFDFFGINLDKLRKSVETATKIEEAEEFFLQMGSVAGIKKLVKDVLEQIESVEADVKGLVNAKAKALYGPDWQVISGERFKITRSKTGDLYLVNGTPNAKFTKVKISVDSKAVEEFVAANDKLPKGIELNDQRGESLRMTFK